MQKNRVFIAELKKGLNLQKLLGRFVFNAFAEEASGDSDPQPSGNQNNSVNFEQLVAQARKEEKEKLYPRIKKAEDEVKVLTGNCNKYLLENAALKEEVEKLKNKQGDDTKVKDLEAKISALEEENKNLKENAPKEEDIRKRIEEEYEIKMYAQEQIAANKGSILTILTSEITGKTKEEIDTAIANAKEKTKSVKKDLGLDVEEEGETDTKKKKAPATTQQKQKKAPVVNPPAGDEEEFDAEYIRNLDPRSEEYKEFRKKMGLR